MWPWKEHADRVALVCESGQSLTYEELRLAGEAIAAQVPARSLVFSLCTNRPGSLIGHLAFLDAQIVPLLLDAQIEPMLLDRLLETYQPDYLWAPAERAEGLAKGPPLLEHSGYVLLAGGPPRDFALHPDLALLLTTSGSVGSRKLVRQSYTNVSSNAAAIADYLEIEPSERSITALPMSYTFGLSVIHSHLARGASLIVTEKTLVQREFWQQLEDLGATSFSGVPYTYEMLDRLRFFRRKLPGLRSMTQAGGKLSRALQEKFAEYASRTGKRFYVMYGQTEATARISYLPYDRALDKLGSIGVAIPGGRLSLVDDDGREVLGDGARGELVYEGPNVMLGYAEQGTDLALGDTLGGRLLTGDLAERDEEGFFYVVGRKKRFLKIFGSRVNLDETESLLKSRFPEAELACGGVDDELRVFLTRPELADALRSYAADVTHLHHSAFKVIAVDRIPKNEAGKTLYHELASAAGARDAE